MFIVQLIAAAIILLIETFNKIEFFKPSVSYHFRQVSSLDRFVNKLIGVEMENSLVYQLKKTLWGNDEEECIYINYVTQGKYEYMHRMDQSILTYLSPKLKNSDYSGDKQNGIYVSVIDSNNSKYIVIIVLSVYEVDSNQFLDENHYSFNRQLTFIQILLSKLEGKFMNFEQCEHNFKYMIHMEDLNHNDIYYLINLKELQVQQFREILHSNNQMIYYFDLNHNILIINRNSKKQYIGSINNSSDITQPLKLFHRGRYLHNISIQNQNQYQFQNQQQIIHLISIIIDEHNGQIKLFIIYYQMSISSGHGSSIILFQEDITKIVFNYLTQMTQYYKRNLHELVHYAQYQDQVYLVIANKNHYYIRPIIQTNDRLQIQKLSIKQYRNYNDSNKINKMILFKNNLVIQQYDYFCEGNNLFYVNLSTIQQYQEDQQISLSKIEDYYLKLDKIEIKDILLYQQPNQIEMIIVLETGDLVIGSLQQPIYVWLYDYVFGSDNQIDDISKLRQDTTFWIILTIILIFLKIYPYLSI